MDQSNLKHIMKVLESSLKEKENLLFGYLPGVKGPTWSKEVMNSFKHYYPQKYFNIVNEGGRVEDSYFHLNI